METFESLLTHCFTVVNIVVDITSVMTIYLVIIILKNAMRKTTTFLVLSVLTLVRLLVSWIKVFQTVVDVNLLQLYHVNTTKICKGFMMINVTSAQFKTYYRRGSAKNVFTV